MSHDVFISHSSKDKQVADAVCAVLEQNGIRCWIAPRDVGPGVKWAEAIIDAIGQSTVMVLIFSQFSNVSERVHQEVNEAIEQGLKIIPFKIENIEPSKGLKLHISTSHWMDAYTKPLDDHLQKLAEAVIRLRDTPKSAGFYRPDAVGGQPPSDDRERGSRGSRWAVAAGITGVAGLLVLCCCAGGLNWSFLSIGGQRESAYRKAARTQIEAFESPLESYFLDIGDYPDSLESLLTPDPSDSPRWRGPYVEKMPVDPWGNPFRYELRSHGGDERSPVIWSMGANGEDEGGKGDDISGTDLRF